MDEIDWIKTIKKVLVFFASFCIGFVLIMFIALVIGSINGTQYTEEEVAIRLLAPMTPLVILGLCYIVLIILDKIMNRGRKVINFNKEYIRDLPRHCSPAICSLIYDLKIDIYKDYTATVLYLCTKKYIDLVKDGDNYKVKKRKVKDYSNLGRCEMYVLNIIHKLDKLDAEKFRKEIIKEAQEKGLITDKKHSKTLKWIIIWCISIILLIIMWDISVILCSVYGAVVFPSLGLVSMLEYTKNTKYKRTKDGKNIALILSGLKRYIKEYTLIKDKEIDYIQILENYIPYALALDEADAVEEFIKYNEEYRDLIYNRGNMK